MVAVFTGLGAGFERGSGAALAGAGLLGGGGLGRSGEGVFLNAASGNLLISRQDEFLVGLGPDVSIARTYNSLGALDDNGDHWRQSSDRRVFGLTGTVNTAGSTVKRVSGDGAEIAYSYNGGGYYETTDGAGAHDRLVYAAGPAKWTWTDGDSRVTESYEVYGADTWRIVEQRDADGNALSFTYTADKLTRIATQDGAYTDYVWTGGNITAIVTGYTDLATSTAKTLTRTRYGYDGSNRLTSVTVDLSPGDNSIGDANVYVTSYTYDGGSKRVASITQTDGSSLSIAYDGSGRVATLTQAVASGDTRVTAVAYFSDRTEITDPRGQITKLYYDGQARLTKIVAPPAYTGAAAQETTFAYDGAGNVTTVTTAAGATAYAYDANGNVTQITDPTGAVTTRGYDSNNRLLVETRTASVGGAAASIYDRYVYDSEHHLRYAISAEGRVTEYDYSASGQLTGIVEYPEHTYAIGSTVPSLGAMESWRAGLADRSSTKIQQFSYDARGNLTETICYGAASASGGAVSTEGASVRYAVYDQAGRLLSRYTLGQLAETFVYDGMGRLTASTDLAGGATTVVFGDSANTITVTTAQGFTTVSTFNKAGELIDKTESGWHSTFGTAIAAYDKNGQPRKSTDATGRTSYYLYDKSGRKIADIGHDGQLIEYRYDQASRLAATIRYQNLITAGQLATLADPTSEMEMSALRPAAHSYDLYAWTIYDAAGRVTETIIGDGSVTSYEYDQAGRLVKTLNYYNTLSSATIAGFVTTPPSSLTLPASHAKDVVVRSFYDRDGRMIGALNGEGYLSQTFYDGAGQKVREISFANATSAGLRAAGTFDQLLASVTPDGANDLSSRYVYDGQGLLRFTIDALGRITELVYRDGTDTYATGLVRKTVSYATPLGSVANYSYATIKAAVATLASSTNDRVSYAIYNNRGQLSYAVDAVGAVTGYRYNTDGLVTKITHFAALVTMTSMGIDSAWMDNLDAWAANNGTDARVTRHYYSNRGDLAYTIDAEGYITYNTQDAEGRAYNLYRYTGKVSATDAWTIADVYNAVASQQSAGQYALSQIRYDNLGRIQQQYDGNGVRRYFDYFANGLLAWDLVGYGQDDGYGAYRQHLYDAAGRLVRTIRNVDAVGTQSTDMRYGYDGLGNVAWTADGRGTTTEFTYDKLGRVLTRTEAAGQAEQRVTRYEYDAFGRGVKTTDARGNASYAYFDQAGRVSLAIDAEGYATASAYTAFGEIASVTRRYVATAGASVGAPPSITTNALDATTSFQYDKLGRLTRVTDAAGAYEEYTLDAFGQRTAARNKLGGVTHYAYDKRGLVTQETLPVTALVGATPTAIVNKFEYDSRGNRTKTIEGFGFAEQRTTIYAYDGGDRLISIAHDTVGVVGTVTGGESNVTPTEYFYYDRRGNLIEKRDAAGARTLYWYDKLDRVTHQISATGTLTRHSYDANGNIAETRVYATPESLPADATGTPPAGTGAYRVTQFSHDKLNRVTNVIVPNIKSAELGWPDLAIWTASLNQRFEYDAMDNVVKATNPANRPIYSYYDKLGRKTVEIDSEYYRTDWTYDADGNVLSERRYSVMGAAPSSTTAPPAAPSIAAEDRVTSFTYDKLGRRLTETRAGVLVHNGAGANISQNATIAYTYNALGGVLSKTEATGEALTYQYDLAGRMTREQRPSFSDFTGTTVTPTIEYAYNALNQLTTSTLSGTTHAQGNADARVTTYAYGVGGRLVSMTDAAGFSRTYRYDGAGRVVREEYARVQASGGALDEAIGTEYDLEGRVITRGVLAKQSGAWTRAGAAIDTTAIQYNAFGEIAQRGFVHFDAGAGAASANYVEYFEYDGAGRVWRATAGDGVWKYFMYDAAGNQTLAIVSEGTAIGEGALVSLDAVLALWSSPAVIGASYVDGVVATLTRYDARNQAIEVREPQRERAAGVREDLLTRRYYNAFGEVAYEIDAADARIDYTYNTMGRLIKIDSPTVSVTLENGAVQSIRPAEQRYYDAAGRLRAVRDANSSHLTPSSSANITRYDPLAGTGYGGSRALTRVLTTPDGASIATGFDIHGEARKITDQIGRVTTQTFDAMGRLAELSHAGGLVESYAYDGLGQRVKHWNNQLGASKAALTFYDQQGRILSQSTMGAGGLADVTTYSYAWNSALATAGLGTFGGWTQTTTYQNGKSLSQQTDAFGREVRKTDLSNRQTDSIYDKAGRLVRREVLAESTTDFDQDFTYFNTGRLSAITALSGGQWLYIWPEGDVWWNWTASTTEFSYDKAGNLTKEYFRLEKHWATYEYVQTEGGWEWMTVPQSSSDVLKNITASYDALGRLSTWTEAGSGLTPGASTSYAYDANGNVRRSNAQFHALNDWGVAQSGWTTQDYWYRYDSLNRVVTTKGQLSGGAIVRGTIGADIAYDLAGQRASVQTNASTETYSYDSAGRLQQANVGGVKRGAFTYDLMGRMLTQTDYEANGATVAFSRAITYNDKSQITDETTNIKRGSTIYGAATTTDYGSGSAYALGSPVSVQSANYENGVLKRVSVSGYVYQWWDGATQSYVSYRSWNAPGGAWPNLNGAPNVNNATYLYYQNVGGAAQNYWVGINDGRARSVEFTNDNNGQAIRRDETDGHTTSRDPHELWYRFAGKERGYLGNNSTLEPDYNHSIARRTEDHGYWGTRDGNAQFTPTADFDQSIAPINSYYQGSSGGAYVVKTGDTLAGIAAVLWGDSALWYKLAEANGLSGNAALAEGQVLNIPVGVTRSAQNVGTFSPYNPTAVLGDISATTAPLPGKDKNCGGFGTVLLVVVAIVVAAVVGPAAMGFWNGVFANGSTLALAGAGATGAAAGSIASQAVGVATGIQDKFSWNAVALAAIGGAVGGGLGLTSASGWGQAAANAAAQSIVTQGIEVALGLQDKFSWAGVAGAALGGGLGYATRNASSAVRKGAQLVASAATRTLIEGTDFGDNILAALPNVIGQSIGEMVAGRMSGSGRAQPVTELDPLEELQYADFNLTIASATPMPLGHTVGRGDTVEKIARERYGDDWRAGVAAIIAGNDLSFNQYGSPIVVLGDTIVIPGLAGSDTQALGRLGGDVVAANTKGLARLALPDSTAHTASMSVVQVGAQHEAPNVSQARSGGVLAAIGEFILPSAYAQPVGVTSPYAPAPVGPVAPQLQRDAAVFDLFANAAQQLVPSKVPPPIRGIFVHGIFEEFVDAYAAAEQAGKGALFPRYRTEVSFKNGREVQYGTWGSVRADVIIYDDAGRAIAAVDLKTAGAKLTNRQVTRYNANLPRTVQGNILVIQSANSIPPSVKKGP